MTSNISRKPAPCARERLSLREVERFAPGPSNLHCFNPPRRAARLTCAIVVLPAYLLAIERGSTLLRHGDCPKRFSVCAGGCCTTRSTSCRRWRRSHSELSAIRQSHAPGVGQVVHDVAGGGTRPARGPAAGIIIGSLVPDVQKVDRHAVNFGGHQHLGHS